MNTRLSAAQRQALGERLKAHRELAGLYLHQVAEATGYTPRTVMNWERGYVPNELGTRVRLAELYGRPEPELFAEVYAYRANLQAIVRASA